MSAPIFDASGRFNAEAYGATPLGAIHRAWVEWNDAEEFGEIEAATERLDELSRVYPDEAKRYVVARGFDEAGFTIQGERPKARRAPVLVPMSELDAGEVTATPWLVERFLQPGTLACMYGEPGAGKSVLCGDLAHAVGSGRSWLGQFKTRPGAVLYLALEGFGSMKRRLLALRQRYGDAPVILASGRFNVLSHDGQEDFAALVDEAKRVAGGALALVVIDTWARLLAQCGVNENSASEVGAAVDVVEAALQRAGGAAGLVVHHAGKNAANGARGSNALLGAVQTELEVEPGRVKTTKQRDADEHPPIGFRLTSEAIGQDADGAEVSAPVVESDGLRQRPTKLRGEIELAWQALCEARPDGAPITRAEWQQVCVEQFLKPERARSQMYKFRGALRKAGYITETQDGLIVRRLAGPGEA